MEVAAYTETWVRVYQITWGYVLGGFSLEEFTSAGRGAMCPSFITFFVFEAPSSPDIPSPHTCQVAACWNLISVCTIQCLLLCLALTTLINNAKYERHQASEPVSSACSKAVCWSWPVGILLACRVELPWLIAVRSPGSPSIWRKTIGGFVHSSVESWWNPESTWLLWCIAWTDVIHTKTSAEARISRQ